MTYDDVVARSWDENRLVSVLIELTYRCNLDCAFCYNDLSLTGKAMTFASYETLLRDLAAMNVLNVTLTGGEPLVHPDFFRIGALARSLGFVIRVKTNAHTVNGELARRLRDEVDPFLIETSLHGATAETHERQTRVAGSFQRLIANIRTMTAMGLRVKVNSTLTIWNEHESEAMYALCDELGVPLRFDLVVSPRDDGDRTPLALAATAEGIRRLLRYESERGSHLSFSLSPPAVEKGKNKDVTPSKHCGAGSAGIAVDPFGNVYPCVTWRKPVANLHETRIHEIWTNAFGGVRAETTAAATMVRAHPNGPLLNFCPGLALALTGSTTGVPPENERVAEIVATS